MKMLQLGLILVLTGSCSQEKMLKYISKNFEIIYPESWSKQEKSNAVFFLSPKKNDKDLFQENVNIILQDLSLQPMNLEQYTELTKKQVIDNFGKTAIISLKDITISNQKGKEFIYNMSYQGKELKLKQYWFVVNNTAYLISYTAEPKEFNSYETSISKMITGFKIK